MALHAVSCKVQLPIKDMDHSPHTSGSLSPNNFIGITLLPYDPRDTGHRSSLIIVQTSAEYCLEFTHMGYRMFHRLAWVTNLTGISLHIIQVSSTAPVDPD